MRFEWDRLPVLEMERLELGSLSEADSPDILDIYGDPEVMRYASDPVFSGPEQVAQMLANVRALFEARAALVWGIRSRASGRVIGTCDLHGFRWPEGRAEAGYLLARRYWSQGLMHEALSRVIRFGFEELGLDAIDADVDPPNARSWALLSRLGFVGDRAADPARPVLTRERWERAET